MQYLPYSLPKRIGSHSLLSAVIIVLVGVVLTVGFARISFASTQTVSSSGGLRTALSSAQAGDIISVQNGIYTGDFTLSNSGTATNNIVVRAVNRGGPVFQNSLFELRGNYGVLEGMVFDDGQVTMVGSNNRVTRNRFRNGSPGGNSSKFSSAVEALGSNNRVDYNEVYDWQRRGLRVRPSSGGNNNRFDHNYLHNFTKDQPSANSGEALQSGLGSSDTDRTPAAIFEYNLLDNVEADDEAISLKSSNNTVQFNTFKNSDASVQNRHGSNNIWKGNTIIGMKALAIYGDNNQVIGNDIRNSYLIIRDGDITQDDVSAGSGGHPSARNTRVACNQVTNGYIGIGMRIPGGSSTGGIPVSNTEISNNTGTIQYGSHTGTFTGSYNCSSVTAVELTATDVGPDAGGGPLVLPTVSLSANPISISLGDFSTLEWSSTNANSCTTSDTYVNWNSTIINGRKSGEAVVEPTVTRTFSLVCEGAGGSTSKSVTVTVVEDQLCHNIEYPEASPDSSYSAPYNWLSATKELLLYGSCSSSSINVTAGNGSANMVVYKTGYELIGGTWSPFSFSGSELAGATNWLVGSGTASRTRTISELSNDNYIIGYTCTLQGGAWKCGCDSASCSVSKWQLQLFGL